MNIVPLVRDVCLVGGGHSHVLFIKRWGMQPLPGARLTLISSEPQSPYSGMLPGLIAGHYQEQDIQVDLRRLCTWAGVRFIEATMTELDLTARQVRMENRPSIAFDVLSLDTGSTPDLSVPGSAEHTTPVKPVYKFFSRWQSLLSRIHSTDAMTVKVGVVGSGAGGFELVMGMRHALPFKKATCQWFVRNDLPLTSRPERVGRQALKAAQQEGIEVFTHIDITSVEHARLIARDGRQFDLDEILWCTAATGPQWSTLSGLSVDSRGFVATNTFLQSVSHSFVFATGDIGTQQFTPSAKAGVFAVRQAPILFYNIRAYLLGETLKPYTPQKDFLSLMATGGKRAIASRGPIVLEANWIWRWKNHIDKTFMQQFTDLPVRVMNGRLNILPDRWLNDDAQLSKPGTMQCKGCGAKVSSRVLERVLDQLSPNAMSSIEKHLSPAADAAAISIPAGTMIQSVDQIDAIVDDPYLLGRIAVLHAISDVVTLNAKPHSAQVIVTLPLASEILSERDLWQLMTGIEKALNEEGCQLIGGHTNQGDALAVGLVVNAILSEESSNNNTRLKPQQSDVLILSQRIGIGTVFAGLVQGTTNGRHVRAAMEDMLLSNQTAAGILQQHNVAAMTDITGFGLLGHLQRLIKGLAGHYGANLDLASIPLLPGAMEAALQGTRSTLWPTNSRILDEVNTGSNLHKDQLDLLCDPQTGGGLLAIVPAEQHAACITALREAGFRDATVVGSINETGTLQVS